ncbi:DUF2809 domain-containing protein [Shewanella sp. Choline-02u-19]|uniref:ribosomal maturation YjgA family protein n=1 Tax=unclassified Shewanella TaxID=196818 RepID=UPI000C346AE9|nr:MULTISPECIES: DUF2809 domain-containing protein [unclassified Shewanella]PKG59228.1 DUF2809 domain-containing protein [Shewanella sp. GutDb-MelDb]PKG73751.1 DUF2809 domain-containing protein [Shewanella sp. GutCb]PKH56325.1 DUF2809 domain-containing protein [Shewanella sp. Bg11-22]PKI27581.1 DUF2809 domain-containing protein [Shewanella sp. Choline-02u-19]
MTTHKGMIDRGHKVDLTYLHFSLGRALTSLVLLLVLIFIALFVRDAFIRPILGDALVVVWLYYLLSSFINLTSRTLVAITILIAFCVEFSQYLNIAELLGIKSATVLSIILGATFDVGDLVAYLAGGAVCIIAEHIRVRLKESVD